MTLPGAARDCRSLRHLSCHSNSLPSCCSECRAKHHQKVPAMPSFRCLGKRFKVKQAHLDKAPGSLFKEAWALATKEHAVSLDTWPDPDLNVLEVAQRQSAADVGAAVRKAEGVCCRW